MRFPSPRQAVVLRRVRTERTTGALPIAQAARLPFNLLEPETANQDGRDYIARGEEFRVVVYLLQNYDIGTLNVAVCDEEYQWELWLDDPFGKRYAASGLTVPKSGDITVEITGEPVRIDV